MKKIFILLALIACQKMVAQQSINIPAKGYKMLDSVKGATLYSKFVKGNSSDFEVLLHVIDLRYIKMGQWVSPAQNTAKTPEGSYLALEKYNKSPYFKLYTPTSAVNGLVKKFPSKLFGVINAAFFEQLTDSTQLAFPIKVNGEIKTAGSSPYGPKKSPKHPYFKKVVLQALAWTDSSVVIRDYDTQTGFPLTSESVQNAIVSYNYKDHPANIIREPTPNLFHIVGTFSDVNKYSPYLFILTVNKATLDDAAAEMRKLGIKSTILTIDGGASVLVHNVRKGSLMVPYSAALPHYLYFLEK